MGRAERVADIDTFRLFNILNMPLESSPSWRATLAPYTITTVTLFARFILGRVIAIGIKRRRISLGQPIRTRYDSTCCKRWRSGGYFLPA